MIDFTNSVPGSVELSSREIKYIGNKEEEYIHSNVYNKNQKHMVDVLERSLVKKPDFRDIRDILNFMNKEWGKYFG